MFNWLIEEFSRDNSFLEIRDAAEKRGHKVKIVESIPFFYDPHWKLFPKESIVVFLGSIQCAKQVQHQWRQHQWDTKIWCTWKNYRCQNYYAYWGKYVFNQNYFLIPLADFIRRKKDIIDMAWGSSGSLFIRPDAGDKPFTGQVWTSDDLDSKLWEISTEDMNPEDLLLVSSPKRIKREWRVVCSSKVDLVPRVITGSRYKTEGQVDYRRELPDNVKDFVEKCVIPTAWQPDPIFVADVCTCEVSVITTLGSLPKKRS